MSVAGVLRQDPRYSCRVSKHLKITAVVIMAKGNGTNKAKKPKQRKRTKSSGAPVKSVTTVTNYTATANKPGRRSGGRSRSGKALGAGMALSSYERDYLKLVMDPCNGPRVKSLLPGNNGAIVQKLDFRCTVTTPTDGTRRLVMAVIVPDQWKTTSFTYLGSTIQLPHELSNVDMSSNGADVPFIVPVSFANTGAIEAIADSARAIAGCVKMRYIGKASEASGIMFGWEGLNSRLTPAVSHFGSGDNGNWVPTRPGNSFIMDGKTASVGATIEAKLNPSRMDVVNSAFVTDVGGASQPQTALPGALNTANLHDTPVLVVGCSGAAAGQIFEVTGTIVYEVKPKTSFASLAPVETPAVNRAQAKGSWDKVVQAVESYAPMLVSTAVDMVTAGPSTWMIKQLGRLTM